MNSKEKIRSSISKFPILTKEEITLIVDKTVVKEFKKGEILLREGQIPKNCYMVVEGCIREYLLKDGDEKSIGFYTETETINPPSKEDIPSKHYLECAEDCLLTISGKTFEEELRLLMPRLDDVFQNFAIRKLIQAKEEWSQFISSSPEERYLNLLNTKPDLFNRVPNHQIASYLGMKPQSLSRIRKRIIDKEK
ncbi:Crp/Fnr family transcriptional regulator [Portibacter lacus]|uniref:Cyclic nucleotide-binding protein n=1 Tax=Portibacter lacus TaxID=1099794 RepID=A0AA37SUH4_9BACT|nr:Crp/Fnr family transcriptional regulator [Portibacter lacus]GLR19914.1 cyclic nucleotide-binding protein [Portibacter lacus]